MRTTVTLDPDVEAKLRAVMRERGVSFKAALNESVRAGLAAGSHPSKRFRVHARPMSVRPGVNLDKALTLAGEMEDAEILRKLELRK
ncbi:MAG: antitoxin [Solirubrobacteraceae bacterium]